MDLIKVGMITQSINTLQEYQNKYSIQYMGRGDEGGGKGSGRQGTSRGGGKG